MRKKRIIREIAKDALDFILDVSRSNHPREFIGILHADEDCITEIFLLPGTLSSDENAIIRMDMLPMGLSYVGSVHSHPHSGAIGLGPSEQDLLMFSKTGDCHIIAFYPYKENSWRCYNSKGEKRELEVVEREEEDFLW